MLLNVVTTQGKETFAEMTIENSQVRNIQSKIVKQEYQRLIKNSVSLLLICSVAIFSDSKVVRFYKINV